MKRGLFAILVFILLTLMIFLTSCAEQEAELANPAAVYCESQGGTLSYEEEAAGTKGLCTLSDGTVCEEWAYYRGECPEPAEEDSVEEPQEPSQQVVESPAPIVGQTEVEPAAISEDVVAELESAFSEVRSYEYKFNRDHYFVKGDKMVVELMNLIRLGRDEKNNEIVINTLFIDPVKKTITGYCENYEIVIGNPARTHDPKKRTVCFPIRDKPFILDYGQYYVETPGDIFNRYKVMQSDSILEESFGTEAFVMLKYGDKTLRVNKKTGIVEEVLRIEEGIVRTNFYTLISIDQLKDEHMERKT